MLQTTTGVGASGGVGYSRMSYPCRITFKLLVQPTRKERHNEVLRKKPHRRKP